MTTRTEASDFWLARFHHHRSQGYRQYEAGRLAALDLYDQMTYEVGRSGLVSPIRQVLAEEERERDERGRRDAGLADDQVFTERLDALDKHDGGIRPYKP